MGLKFISAIALALTIGLVVAPDSIAKERKAHPPAKGKHAAKPGKQAKRTKPAAAPRSSAQPRPAVSGALDLRSNVALVVDNSTGEAVVSKNIRDVQPIASITKLMTALVVLDGNHALTQRIAITGDDIDSERGSRSRLKVGSELPRSDLLHLALMASENRAAHALGRSHPGGLPAFVEAMNEKARALGMERTRFVDPTGLSSSNVSTAEDLVKLVKAANKVNLIRAYSTDPQYGVALAGREVRFHNTNRLVAASGWEVLLSKTGFINEAGRCLVMEARVDGRALTFVLLDSWGKYSRIGDANRIRKWLTSAIGERRQG
jgi:D-alanyl-D-alanine endopeptidase (penicillin-binding protein 7)